MRNPDDLMASAGVVASDRNFKDDVARTFSDAGWTVASASAYAGNPDRYERLEKVFLRAVPYFDVHGKEKRSEYGYVLRRDGVVRHGRIEVETIPDDETGSGILSEIVSNAKYRYPESEIVLVLSVPKPGMLEWAKTQVKDPAFIRGGKKAVAISPDEFPKWFAEAFV